jgi:hypothetical protein
MTQWAPVVFGRTPASDSWWRAVPEDLDETGWLGTVVHAAVSGGHELASRPRLLLAQSTAHRIVGVACQAADLSPDMWSDGQRELYCFVGWAAARPGGSGPGAPQFGEFERNYRQWAAPVYARMLARVWEAPSTASFVPELTRPEPALWEPVEDWAGPGPRPDEGLWPEEAWPALWTAVQAVRQPLICVVGWQNESSARSEAATHLGAADAPARAVPLAVRRQEPAPVAPYYEQVPEELQPPALVTPPAGLPLPVTGPATKPVNRPVTEPATGPDSEPKAGRLQRPRRLSTLGKVGAAVGVAALAAVVTVIVAGTGSDPVTTPTPPVTLQVSFPASAKPATNSLIQYAGGTLSAGQSTARLAVWSGSPAPGRASCKSALRKAPAATKITALAGLKLCIQLKGEPARYGNVEIKKVTKAAVTAVATIWP